jgi:hypothetical protein
MNLETMFEMKEIIAERRLICATKDGERKPITIRIAKLYLVSDTEWACSMALEGLYKRLLDVHAVDSFQALNLAIASTKKLLSSIEEDGGHFYFEDDNWPIGFDEIFR